MAERASIAILILTRNEEANLPAALASVADWAKEVFVLDSGSTDRTEQIAKQFGAQFVYHPWAGFAGQKNWGLDNLPITARWVFILDADEIITPRLRDEVIRVATEDTCRQDAFYVNRCLEFMGQEIRHCGYYPSWNMRFFRHGRARYEEREVHEHMICTGPIGYLKEEMQHIDRRGLEHFIAKHNNYSTLEARELFRIQKSMSGGTMKFDFWAGPIERRRWIKHKIWPRIPCRALARFVYMYILKLGFLDGRAGLNMCILLASYEHQISVKLEELWAESKRAAGSERAALPAVQPPPIPPPLEHAVAMPSAEGKPRAEAKE